MPKSTFDTYKSTNDRLHNKLAQADEYEKFLKRIESIVDRKRKVDRSSDFYMTFLNKSRQKSNQQKSLDKEFVIQLQNKNLLTRIQKQKTRKFPQSQSIHEVHMQEKRLREQEKINQENGKMAQRIMKQNSYLVNKRILSIDFSRNQQDKSRVTKEREQQQKFFDSRINTRKLPKLVKTPSVSNVSLGQSSSSVHYPAALR